MTKKTIKITENDKKLAIKLDKYLDKKTESGTAGYKPEIDIIKNKKVFLFKLASSADQSLAIMLMKKFKLKPYKRDEWEDWISFTK